MISFNSEDISSQPFNPNTDEINTRSSILLINDDDILRCQYFYYNFINDKEKFDKLMMSSRIKIIDLGFSRYLDDNGMASTFCGSPISMAPEVWTIKFGNFKKNIKYNDKIDMWSIGAITYHLICGIPPFVACNFYEIFKKKIEEGNYHLPNKLEMTLELIDFLNGLLQFDPDNRLKWTEVLNHPYIKKGI